MVRSGGVNAFRWLDELRFNHFHGFLLVAGGLTLVFSGYNLQIIAYVMPLVSKEWQLSPVEAGAMVSYGFFGLMVGAVAFGMAADVLGRKKALLVAIATFSLFNSAACLAPGYSAYCVLRFFAGVGIGGAFPLTIALVSEYAPPKIRARLLTAVVGGFTLGWAAAASLSIGLMPAYGWRIVHMIGLAPLFFVPILWVYLPESVRFLAGRGRKDEAAGEMRRVEVMAGLEPVRWTENDFAAPVFSQQGNISQLFRGDLAAMTILLWSTYLLNTMALYGLVVWLPTLLMKAGYSLVKSYSYGMIQALGAATGGFLVGCLMDAFGRKQGLLLTYFLGGLSVILFGLVTSDLFLYISGAAIGLFVVGAPTALNVVCGEVYPTRIRSTGVGWTQAVGRIGSILGPIVGGLLQALELSLREFFFVFSIPCFLCMIIVLLYRVNVKGDALEAVSLKLLKGRKDSEGRQHRTTCPSKGA